MVSIIVPIYNVEQFLHKCVNSILSQSYRDLEVVLVDDGSTDSCPKIVDNYAAIDKRVKAIHKINGGLVSARQAGLLASTGEHVIYVDGDDWIMENCVENLLAKASKYDVDLVCCASFFYYKNRIVEWRKPYRTGLYNKKELVSEIFPTLIQGPKAEYFQNSAWAKLFKREKLLPCQLNVDPKIVMGEDIAFTKSYIASISSMYLIDDCLYCYNCMNSESITHAKKCLSWENPKMIASILYKINTLGIYDFKPQIDRYIVHSLFHVAVSQFNSGESYQANVRKIKKELSDPVYSQALKEASFACLEGFFAQKSMQYNLFFLIYLFWKKKFKH